MQAVLICGQAQAPGRALGALDVGGISLALRQARSVFHAGGQRLLVLTDSPAAYGALLLHDRAAPLQIQLREQAIDGLRAGLSALRHHLHELDDELWIIPGDRVMTPGVLRGLARQERRRGVALVDAQGDLVAARVTRDLLTEELLDGTDSLREAITLLADHELIHVQVTQAPELMAVRDANDARLARQRLLRTLRKPLGRQTDGVTAYLINRPVSLACSRLLIHTPLTPNMVTTLNLLLGLVAGAMIWTAQPLWMALGALAFQFVSIFDGIDGELARMKLLMSKRGEWFDTVGDDIVKMSMYVSLGHAVYVQTHQSMFAAMTVVGFLWTALMVGNWYLEVARQGLGSLNNVQWWWEREGTPDNAWRKFLIGWGYLLKRDTYTLLLVLLVMFGFPALSLSLMFLGINIIFWATVGQKALALARGARHASQDAQAVKARA